MIIKKVNINNFKSIDNLDIDFDSVGNSYTKIFVGLNESGKSNILEALSLLCPPLSKVDFSDYCNQKNENATECKISFYMELDNAEKEELVSDFKSYVNGEVEIKFSISNIVKKVEISRNSSEFTYSYDMDVVLGASNYYLKKVQEPSKLNSSKMLVRPFIINLNEDETDDDCVLITKDNFYNNFGGIIDNFIEQAEPLVSIWKPDKEYLISNVDLNEFKNDVEQNKPLKNIFKLSGYDDEAILNVINDIKDDRKRSRLVSKLKETLNAYINKIWSNNIDLIIEITETGRFSLFIRDKGNDNVHDRFRITDRSQGAQHFLSLILSLSLETNNKERKNELILIDEPENHLHPSGIRDLAKELLKIGTNNYVFFATHSPFMIDKSHKERHYVVTKNNKAITEVHRIREYENIFDDEVLRDAFGIDVYRDLLNPYSILVEGSSDKIMMQKTFECLGYKNIGITNGHGCNIITLANKMNYDELSIVVVLDDDKEGQVDKAKIIKIGGRYTSDNVFTIRDLNGNIIEGGTIEDTLDPNYVVSQFKQFYKDLFNENIEISFTDTKPVLSQIVKFLKDKKVYEQYVIDDFKKRLSENFNPTKSSLCDKNIKLKELALSIYNKFTLQ
ncbi:MAG: AAA family ATPase [Bacteroidales bacterium]|nr:AAA family ATPase [Bacteroidales bacterium]